MKRRLEDLALDALAQGPPQRLGSVHLQQLVQVIDVAGPLARPPMHHLGQKDQGRFAEVEQQLPLEVALATLAGDGCDEGRPMPPAGWRLPPPDELPGVHGRPRCAPRRGRGTACPRSQSPPAASSTDACRG